MPFIIICFWPCFAVAGEIWRVSEAEISDVRAVRIITGGPGVRVGLYVTPLKKGREVGKTQAVSFVEVDGKIAPYAREDALGFIFPDACALRIKYRLTLVIAFEGEIEPQPQIIFSDPPGSQATLFKFPSEKSAGHAVILMRTNGSSAEFIHFTEVRRGASRELGTFSVESYYYSNRGLFTRLYLDRRFFTGQKASMHHVSADLSTLYSVCVSLAPRRQELEGY